MTDKTYNELLDELDSYNQRTLTATETYENNLGSLQETLQSCGVLEGEASASADAANSSAISAADSATEAQNIADSINPEIYTYARQLTDFYAEKAQNNERYAASGFVHHGKHSSATIEPNINEGLYVDKNKSNGFVWGRYETASFLGGNSKTAEPVINIAGAISSIISVNSTSSTQMNEIKFPEAPDGTVTYDSATGEITDFTTDVDTKYGDVASTTNEAVARAFEGDVKNGDFRFGVDNWSSAVVTDGKLICQSATAVSRTQGFSWDESSLYEIEVVVSEYNSGIIDIVKYGIGATDGNVLSVSSVGVHKVTFDPSLLTGNNGSDNLINIYNGSAVDMIIDRISVRKATNKVVTERVDMFGLEAWLEEITAANPYAYPLGLIQSQASTFEGLSTSTSSRPVTYYAVYDGDTSSQGKGRDFFNATTAEKEVMLSNPEHNIYFEKETGKWLQWRIRQRTIAGAGNGDWQYTDAAKELSYSSLSYVHNLFVVPQGATDSVPVFVATSVNLNGFYQAYSDTGWSALQNRSQGSFLANGSGGGKAPDTKAYNGECYFYVMGLRAA